MFADLHDLIELLQKLAELTFKFVVGDVFDILKILLSIFATVYFGRRYVKQHLRRLLDRQIQEIAAQEQPDRVAIKAITDEAIKKAQGRSRASTVFEVRSAFGTAARYWAQRQPNYAVELLERETIIADAAAQLCEKRAQGARHKAATAQLQVGLMAKSSGDTIGALRAFKRMLELNPEDVDGLRFSGQELEQQGRLTEAREQFERLEQIAVGTDEKLLLGESLRSLARVNDSFQDAVALLEQCLSLEKSLRHDLGLAHTWKTIGDVRSGVGHWRYAEEAYDNALKILEVLRHTEAHGEALIAKARMMESRAASRTSAEASS